MRPVLRSIVSPEAPCLCHVPSFDGPPGLGGNERMRQLTWLVPVAALLLSFYLPDSGHMGGSAFLPLPIPPPPPAPTAGCSPGSRAGHLGA